MALDFDAFDKKIADTLDACTAHCDAWVVETPVGPDVFINHKPECVA